MKFHDAVRKHIKVLDGIQKKMRDEIPSSQRLMSAISKFLSNASGDAIEDTGKLLTYLTKEFKLSTNEIDKIMPTIKLALAMHKLNK